MTDDTSATPDFRTNVPRHRQLYAFDVVRALPGLYVMLEPHEPFAILEASDSHLAATRMERRDILGQPFFAIFPDDPDDPDADGERNLRASFLRVAETGEPERMAVQRYPIQRPDAEGGGFEVRFWQPLNSPVHDQDGQLVALLHRIVDVTEQHRQDSRLQRATDLLRIAERTAHIGGWSVNLETGTSEWSDSVCDIYGLPRGHAPTVDEAMQFVTPEYRERIDEVFRACSRFGEAFDEEFEIIATGGRRVPVRAIGEATRDSLGRIVAAQGAFQDLTQIRAAEDALARSIGRFHQFADSMPMIVWTALSDGTVDFVNVAFCEYTGIDRDELDLASAAWIQTIHPADMDALMEAWPVAVAGGEAYSLDFRIRRHDGQYRWHHTTARPVLEDDQLTHWYGTTLDVEDLLDAGRRARAVADELTATLNSMTEGFYALDKDWRITFVNPAGEALLQRPRDELLGRVLWDLFPEARESVAYEAFTEAMRTGQPQSFDLDYEPLGTWFEASAYPSVSRLSVYFRDVTRQRQSEASLRLSEGRFRAIAHTVTDTVWDWDLATDTVWWDEGPHGLLGLPGDTWETSIHEWEQRIHPDDRERVSAGIRASWSSPERTWVDEYRFLRGDNTYADVLDRGAVIWDDSGRAIRMVGGMSDLSGQRAAQAQIRRQAALIEQARDAILVFGMDGRITSWNSAAERLYQLSVEEARGRPASELLGKDPEAFQAALDGVVAAGEWQGQLLLPADEIAGTAETIVVCRWTLLFDERGAPDAILAIHSDITEQVILERQLQQSQRLESLGQLTGGIAHDFNNLLTVVLGSAETLIDALNDDERLRSSAEITRAAALRGAELTKRLLAFARRQPLAPGQHDVNRITEDMEPLLRRTIGESIRIALVLADDLAPATVDDAQLESCILNLAINARDAMPEGGLLSIETANVRLDEDYASRNSEVVPGRYVMLAISDTGTGMPPEVAERVFEPFFTTKAPGRGSGLGLSMVHGFVKQSGGHVKVYSELGEGTTIKIYLPRSGSADAVADARSTSPSTEVGGGERILVVEDDDLVRAHVSELLLGMGYRVTAVSSGADALARLESDHGFDLLFTDVVMPGMNGQELADRARAIFPELHVLFTSGYTENAIVQQGRIPPGTFLLSKPYTRQELETKLQQAIHRAHPDDRTPA